MRYNLSRQQAADILKVSTRTVDRYIKSGKLSYKKVGNKVFLAEEEVRNFDPYQKEINFEGEVISNSGENIGNKIVTQEYSKSLDEKLDKFMDFLKEKDKQLEEKNKIIIMLQKRIVELEEKLKNVVALPDYTREKEKLMEEKKDLEKKLRILQSSLKVERTKNLVFVIVAVIFILLAIFLLSK